ncbi:unnamed protein product [Symbiodinium sp. CCMP2592]|nr:unnamed protein product [Symbiodinium sp. CCMP2592]
MCEKGQSSQVGSFKLSSIPLNATGDAGNTSEGEKIISEVISQTVVGEMEDFDAMPDPKEKGEKGGGMGELGKSLEFLMFKVAQLETLAELQQTELGMQRVLIDKMQKKMDFDEAEVSMVQKSSEESVQEAHDTLTRVLHKHARQREHREYHPEAHEEEPAVQEDETAAQEETAVESRRALLQKRQKHRRSAWGPVGKAVKSGWDNTGGRVVNEVDKQIDDAVKRLDGTGLTGGALTKAYETAKAAGNGAKFLANTAITTVEMAAAIIAGGGNFGASCTNHPPWLGMHGSRLDIHFGHQHCSISLGVKTITLFNFNWGRRSVNIPVLDMLPEQVRKVTDGRIHELFPSHFAILGHIGWDLVTHCHNPVNHVVVEQCLARFLAYHTPVLDLLPEQVRKVTDGRIAELFPSWFGILGHIGWEVVHHCPGHHNHIEVTKCLARSLAKYAPPFDFLPDHFKVLHHIGFEVIHNCGANHNHIEVTKCLARSLAKYAPPLDFLPEPMKALAGGDLPLSFLPEPVQVLAGGKLSTIIECAQPNSHGDLIKCLGSKIIASVPPLNFLNRLGDIFTEFIEVFAKVASTVATSAMKEGQSLLQIAAASEFPAAGAPPQVHHRGANLLITAHSQHAPAGPSSFLQRVKGDDPPAAVKWSFEDYGPEAHTLVTQFAGRETSTGSCLAFAPKNMTGSNNQATEADWKAKSEDDFVELKPWAVPCGNQWMKTKWDKWQGYSMYTTDLSIEKCLTVKFQVNMQPVVAFVGGIQFDLLPGPLAEVDTTVCWPRGQPDGLDLSVLRTVIKSNGVMLFSRTLRLSKRFGDSTDFVEGNINKGHQTSKSFFGVNAAPDESGTGIASMQRSSFLQANQSAKAKEELEEAVWQTQDDLYFASIEYGKDLGVNITSELGGHAAQEQLEALLSQKEKKEEAEEEEEAEEKQEVDETFKLFSFKNPGMINFEVQGLLHGNWLQLGIQMAFGPYESPHMKIPLLNLADQFALILAALPPGLVSVESRAKAIASLKDFSSKDVKKVKAQVPKLIPGTTIGLRNPHWGRYMRMNDHAHMDTSHPQGLDFPAGWEWELFTVVDAGNGEVAFHSPRFNRFVWMEGETCIATLPAPAHHYGGWAKARFMEVTSGDNTIALYNKAEGRFLRLHNTVMDASPQVSSKFPAGWAYERFQIVPTGPYGGIKPGMVVALYNTHWKKFIRMHGDFMDPSVEHPPHLANKAGYPWGWTWEQFTVVDGGNGLIALHNAIHNRFVSMRGGTTLGTSQPMAANALPANWDWERFAVVPGGHLEIALHNHPHNSFVTMTAHTMQGHAANAQDYHHGWWLQRFKVVPLGEVEIKASDASWSFD